ncbi:hypothetical protein [Pseudomonas petrae]|uniref:Type II toxin-antitoxin system RelE/ParE family toxin n=1 Tax=Pseudomonas petrae TaxID=2912190 RepID=A0ABS9HZC7_9PSED|nr:hypothetical protein [Pseudomonas petrae]MCF7540610.1 hypothetical protein [Pseudomonas petrae]
MTRTYKEVASEAYDDLVSQSCAHADAKAVFRAISKLLPPGDVAGDLARIGEAHADEWRGFAETGQTAWIPK